MNDHAMKHIGDGLAALVTVGTVASILPPLAAAISIIWTLIRIFETRTVRSLIARWRD